MKRTTIDWLKSADNDLAAARLILKDESLTSIAAFHCQQALEKDLKACLEEKTGEIPKVHNLSYLMTLTSEYIDLTIDETILESLNSIYLDGRYPGELGMLPNGLPTTSETQLFIKYAELIHNQITTFLQSL